MTLTDRGLDPINSIPDEHGDLAGSQADEILYRSSLSSSTRPSTPASNPSTFNDLEVSPKTISSSSVSSNDIDIDSPKKDKGSNTDGIMFGQLVESDDPLVPAPPAKSSLRASRLPSLSHKNSTEDTPVQTTSAPHILYLSSEEDASSSADDFSDCDYLSDGEDWEPAPQQPARMISVVFSGKPSIVELRKRCIAAGSAPSPKPELLRTQTEPRLNRRSSASSDLSAAYHRPLRTSSMMMTTTTTTTKQASLDTQRHSFLQTDPFANKPDLADEREAQQTRKATTMFKRTLSLVRKRSKPGLNPAGSMSREHVTIQTMLRMDKVGEGQVEHHVSEQRAQTPVGSGRKSSQSTASSPISEAMTSPISPGKKLRQGFMSRRRSIRV